MTVRERCQCDGVTQPQFYWWRRKLTLDNQPKLASPNATSRRRSWQVFTGNAIS